MYLFMIRHDEVYRHAVSFLNWGDIHVDKEWGVGGGGRRNTVKKLTSTKREEKKLTNYSNLWEYGCVVRFFGTDII